MRFFRAIRILRNKPGFRKYFSNFIYAVPLKLTNVNNRSVKTPLNHYNIGKYSTENDEDPEEHSILETETLDVIEQHKHILFKESIDGVINKLNNCYTTQDVWSILDKHKNNLSDEQIVQSILVLKDIQNVFCAVNSSVANSSLVYLNELKESKQFVLLLDKIQEKLEHFNPQLLSYLLLYLQRLGLDTEEPLMLQLAERVKNHLEKEFDLSTCSRWIKVVFLEKSIRPYYMSLNLIPKILQVLDNCDSIEHLADVSVCLYKLHNMVTPVTLKKYTGVVEEFLKKNKLQPFDYSTILKIISFLSLPYWRDQNVELTSKCMLLLKNKINKMDTPYLLLLYEVFFKIQEPGELLNEIQRSAAKLWQQYQESGTFERNKALKLFSSLIFFSSPLQRVELRKDVVKLLQSNTELRNLIIIRKIFSYVKISDQKLCQKYWDNWSGILKRESEIFLVTKSCLNYMLFNIDIDNYRYFRFEKLASELIRDIIRRGDIISQLDLSVFLAFIIYYSNDAALAQTLLDKLKQNPRQLKPTDILILSQTFKTNSQSFNKDNFKEIGNILTKNTEYLLSINEGQFEIMSLLIRAAIQRDGYDNDFVDNLLLKFKELDCMSSKLMENIAYIFFTSNTLIPEVFNKITEYIVKNKENIIGFNAEKILYLCFHLAYYPINADTFFRAVTDIIIRDQERLSGLAFLQSALSLSFFNKLPSFLVKQIFNEEFMDRLDKELLNCYSKDKYPQRVRQTLMHLNRTVCLEYPEFNVPWFHEKYIKDVQTQYLTAEHKLPKSIKEYLVEIVGQDILENIVTPYGYHINFVVSLNKDNNVVSPNSKSIRKRVAVLLVKNYAFTRFYSHLKGTYQVKIKHLEIMGYSVSILEFDEWINLLYSTERLDYLKKLIWPEKYEIMYTTNR